ARCERKSPRRGPVPPAERKLHWHHFRQFRSGAAIDSDRDRSATRRAVRAASHLLDSIGHEAAVVSVDGGVAGHAATDARGPGACAVMLIRMNIEKTMTGRATELFRAKNRR